MADHDKYPPAPPSHKDKDYLMRSEKRSDTAYRRAKRRRTQSRTLTVVAVILGLLIWPVGIVILWLRKVRLFATTKFLLSLITLIFSILMYGTLLNIPFQNESLADIQDQANRALDSVYETVLVTMDHCVDGLARAGDVAADFGNGLFCLAAHYTADALGSGADMGEELSRMADEWIASLEDSEEVLSQTAVPSPVPTATGASIGLSAPTRTPGPTATAAPQEPSNPPATTQAP